MSQYYTLGTWTAQGGPNYIFTTNSASGNDMVIRASKTVPYDQINDRFITINGSKNILIGSNDEAFDGVDIYATFIIGTGVAKNTFGYFIFDRHDPQNTIPTKFDGVNWVPMTYSDRNTVDVDGKSILKKTIVYPLAKNTDNFTPYYLYEDPGVPSSQLPTGSRVRLLYNTSDPTQLFPNNVGIGFFIIPDGWDSLTGTVNESIEAYYTYNVFNDSTPTDQSLLFVDRLNSTKSIKNYVITFEDRPYSNILTTPNRNFCNTIIQITVFPRKALQVLDNDLVFGYNETILTTKLETDYTGTCIKLSDTDFNTLYSQVSNNFIIDLQISDPGYRASLYTLLNSMIKRSGTTITTNSSSITILFSVDGSDIQKNIYFIDSMPNLDLASPLNGDISCWQNYYDLYITGNSNITQATVIMGSGSPIVISPADQTFTANYPYSNGQYRTLGTWISTGAPDYLAKTDAVAKGQEARALRVLQNQTNERLVAVNGSKNILIEADDEAFMGVDIYATFLIASGHFGNTFGYFIFDRHDPQNTIPTKFDGVNWVPMTYSDRNMVDVDGKSILKKTIVFPSTRTLGGVLPAALPLGSKVRLLYDTSDPTKLFPDNIGIGFFIISDAFSQASGTFDKIKDPYYTYSIFNGSTPAVQSLLFIDRLSSTELITNYIISFEDLPYLDSNPIPSKNFSSPTVQISVFPRKPVRILDNDLVFFYNETISSTRLEIDNSGICIKLSDSDLNLLYSSSFNTFTITLTISNSGYTSSLFTLLNSMIKRSGTTISINILSITITFSLDGSDSQRNIYFIDSLPNLNLISPVDNMLTCWQNFYDLYVTGNINILGASITILAEGTTQIVSIPSANQIFSVTDPYIVDPYYTLGSWTADGVPNYSAGTDSVTNHIFRTLKNTPENSVIAVEKPSYIKASRKNYISLNSSTYPSSVEIYANFIYSHSTGYHDIIGYYVFQLNSDLNAPYTYNDLKDVGPDGKSKLKYTILYPDATIISEHWSLLGNSNYPGNGNLDPGEVKIQLKYDPATGETLFPNNTGIGFFVIRHGWGLLKRGDKIPFPPHNFTDPNLTGYVWSLLYIDELRDHRYDSNDARYVVNFKHDHCLESEKDYNDHVLLVTVSDRTAVKDSDNRLQLPDYNINDAAQTLCDEGGWYILLPDSTVQAIMATDCINVRYTLTIQSTLASLADELYQILQTLTMANNTTITQSLSTLTITTFALKNNTQNMILLYRHFLNKDVVSPIDLSRKSTEHFRSIYIMQRNYLLVETLTIEIDSLANPTIFNIVVLQTDILPLPRWINTRSTRLQGPLTYYTGSLRFFDDNEIVMNVLMAHYLPDDPLSTQPTLINYLSIMYHDKHLIIDMFNVDKYYKAVDVLLVPTVPDPSFFFVLLPGDIPNVSANRINYFNSVVTGPYDVRYLLFISRQMGIVYLELLFAPYWTGYINQINILGSQMIMANKNISEFVKKKADGVANLLS